LPVFLFKIDEGALVKLDRRDVVRRLAPEHWLAPTVYCAMDFDEVSVLVKLSSALCAGMGGSRFRSKGRGSEVCLFRWQKL
jgi:hypothetical protein